VAPVWSVPLSLKFGCDMEQLLRGAAEALNGLAEKANRWADWAGDRPRWVDPSGEPREFAGIDIVGLDFSTSIRRVARHVITGWQLYRTQVASLQPDHGVWVFGVNAGTFPITDHPVPPDRLPRFGGEHFQYRGFGCGLIETGSAFYDYLQVALKHARRFGAFETILLCRSRSPCCAMAPQTAACIKPTVSDQKWTRRGTKA
jgi:hypothetical protein